MQHHHQAIVLIVDDEADTRERLAAIIADEHTKVLLAADGPAALKITAATRLDVVLLDIDMPGMDGFETLRQMVQQGSGRRFPVIFLAAADDPERMTRAFETGTADVVSKPLQAEEVRARVERQLLFERMRKQLERKNRQLQREIAEHRRSEARLRESEWRFRGIFNHAGVGIAITDQANGRFLEVNDRLATMFGYSPEELLGMTIFDVTYEKDIALSHRYRGRLVQDDSRSIRFEKRYRRKDGSIFPGEIQLTAWHDANGAVCGNIGVLIDLTERNRAQQQLREANAIINESPAVAFLWRNGEGWPVEFVTRNVHSLLGYVAREFESGEVRYADVIHPEDLPRVTREVEAANRQRGATRVVHEPYRIVTKDGKVKWMDDRTSIRRDLDGRITHYRGVVLDITERRLAKEALRKAGRSYKMLSQCGQAVIHAEQETPLLRTVCKLLVTSGGYLMAWIGKKVHDRKRSIEPLAHAGREQGYLQSAGITWADDRPQGKGPAGQVLRSGRTVAIGRIGDDPRFSPWRTEALRRGYRSVLAMPLWVEGNIYGCLVIYAAEEDAFDPREMELLGTLADDVAFGIGVLHTRRKRMQALQALEEARATAEAANRAKGEFLANMSHEIRTPLNAVTGLTRLALNTELSDKQRNYLENIDISAHALLGVINDILDFSKIEAGKLDLEKTDFPLSGVLEKLPVLLGMPLVEKDLELLFVIGRGVPRRLHGDPMRLTQVLLNLVGNAVKFTDRGEVTVGIDLARAEAEQVFLRIEVADTGIGIPADKQESLFDAFSQVDSSDTRKAGGTGLGLAICNRLVALMGGTLEVKSVPGKGSRFSFIAGFGRAEEPEELPTLPEDLHGTKVLAADDNAKARAVLAGLLRSFCLRPTVVDSGEALVQCLERDNYGLVLIDCKMPGTNGLDIAKRIRSRPRHRNLPIVAMRNAFKDESACTADDRWFTTNLAKPVLPEGLFYALAGALAGASNAPPLLSAAASPAPRPVPSILRGAHILIAEDDPINQQVLRETLEMEGLRVRIVDNGKEALEQLRTTPFDAVLLDLQMPGMNGYETCRRMRALPFGRGLPIIAVTAHALPDQLAQCREAGIDACLTKPTDPALLFAELQKRITPAGQRTDTHRVAEPTPEPARTDHLPGLPGFESTPATERLQRNQRLFHRLLLDFHDRYGDIVERIETALNQGNTAYAIAQLHKLDGVAGNLGAFELQHSALHLEQVLREQGRADPTSVAEFHRAGKEVMAGLAHLEPLPNNAAYPAQPDQGEDSRVLQRTLRELARLLEKGSTRALACLPTLRKAVEQTELRDDYTTLIRQVESYHFKEALETMRRVSAGSGAGLHGSGT